MINHFRTYLLNRDASFFEKAQGNEYIDPDFHPVKETPELQFVRSLLFGSNPDAGLLNYRFRQFSTLIQSVRMENHVKRFDSRVTYNFDDESLFANVSLEKPIGQLIMDVIESVNNRPDVYHAIFSLIEKTAPEYKQICLKVTDSIYRFIAVLFAAAAAAEMIEKTEL